VSSLTAKHIFQRASRPAQPTGGNSLLPFQWLANGSAGLASLQRSTADLHYRQLFFRFSNKIWENAANRSFLL
jgi:hypothetical protein